MSDDSGIDNGRIYGVEINHEIPTQRVARINQSEEM
jgi:hypothetical protein